MTALPDIVAKAIDDWLSTGKRPLVLGICGAQGSGKSTLAGQLEKSLSRKGLKVAVLSLDDLYLGTQERCRLAQAIHPLFVTRGVPGTHDVSLGLEVIDDLRAGKTVALPRFDKASDEPVPGELWPVVEGGVDMVLFEGWCVGATPEDRNELTEPVNKLEAEEDTEGRWREAVNDFLSGSYQALFNRIDRLILLAAPGFEVVHEWRVEQERDLASRLAEEGRDPGAVMGEAEIARFISHYERITRSILKSMPSSADLVVKLDKARGIKG
ncbi:adenylyl-sulfate kinase [Croceicoccus mobilis]|uniref:adenylyl-sulfate kinase n=1 Tax=Croceicoccus mobilis TaxID=1703339 RepID=UPI000836A916|nr:adenylyl-sulfate kinase [Croceicoccus mobilis]